MFERFFKKPKKVFCEDCKWYNAKPVNKKTNRVLEGSGDESNTCSSPYLMNIVFDNDGPIHKGTGEVMAKLYTACGKHNSNNDCVWFNRD